MPVEPTGIEGLPLKGLKDLLEASSTFASWAAASGRVHYVGVADPSSATRPYAIVGFTQDGFGLSKRAGGTSTHHAVRGAVSLFFFNDVDTGQTIPDQFVTFMNTLSAIIKEMADAAGGSTGAFDFGDGDRIDGPHLNDEDEDTDEPDYITAVYVFAYAGSVIG